MPEPTNPMAASKAAGPAWPAGGSAAHRPHSLPAPRRPLAALIDFQLVGPFSLPPGALGAQAIVINAAKRPSKSIKAAERLSAGSHYATPPQMFGESQCHN